MMLVLARGISHGTRTALLVVTGIVIISGFIQILCLALGMAGLIKAHPAVMDVLRYLGAGYLFYIGIKMIASSISKKNFQKGEVSLTAINAIKEGMINNFSNPKVLLFMLAFLPQFVNPHYGKIALQLTVLGLIQKLMAFIILSAIAFASAWVGKIFLRYPAALVWQQRFTGLIMVLLALRLVTMGSMS
ncbi:lysine transporter LysE [Pantoea coffeiphila]|uniref:Lysine transporter LysE n=2 Tax=Pantoea coffeiphila TaxID=1465635 RepID=A0A2S9IGX6_9GAMM|nr:lysine transporter LysE [Pantoea coffeiphila]